MPPTVLFCMHRFSTLYMILVQVILKPWQSFFKATSVLLQGNNIECHLSFMSFILAGVCLWLTCLFSFQHLEHTFRMELNITCQLYSKTPICNAVAPPPGPEASRVSQTMCTSGYTIPKFFHLNLLASFAWQSHQICPPLLTCLCLSTTRVWPQAGEESPGYQAIYTNFPRVLQGSLIPSGQPISTPAIYLKSWLKLFHVDK